MALTRKAPMKRTPIARSRPAPKMTARRGPARVLRRDQAALDACRGECCYLRLSGICLGSVGIDTVVPAHSNQSIHGKGRGIKAHDRYTVPACYACHAVIDSGHQLTRAERFGAWDCAYARWEPIRTAKLSGIGKALAEIPPSKVVPRVSAITAQISTEATV